MNRIKTHGHSRASGDTLTYKTWQQLKQRCSNPKPRDAKSYRDRGITFDPRWAKFENFLEDMGCKPDGYTLDRIDNNGPYSKENCHWACSVRQNHNSRVAKLDLDKVTKIRWMHAEGFKQKQIAEMFGVHSTTISHLLNGKTWAKEEKPVIKKVQG